MKRAQRIRMRILGADHAELRRMARAAVWAEIGGKGAGWQGQTNPHGFKSQREMNAEGAGRTNWVGMPEWARGLGMSRAQIFATVAKAIAGKPLGSKQRQLMAAMLAEIGGREDCPF